MYVLSRATIILYPSDSKRANRFSSRSRTPCLITVIWWRRSMLLIGSFPIPDLSSGNSSLLAFRPKKSSKKSVTDLRSQFLMTTHHGLIRAQEWFGEKTGKSHRRLIRRKNHREKREKVSFPLIYSFFLFL